jgi:hypothetical protein
MTINGPGAKLLTVSGNDATNIFVIDTGVTATISGLTIAHGYLSSGAGAGILDNGTLTLVGSVVTNNQAPNGAGLMVTWTMTVLDSTIANNNSTGVYFDGTSLLIANSTISGNTAVVGGGMNLSGDVTLINTTVAFNTASYEGGNVYVNCCTLTIGNTIIGDGSAPMGPDWAESPYANPIHTLGHNLVPNISGPGDLVYPPLLGPLQDNGGSTRTHAFLFGSLGVDAGDNNICADPPIYNLDQRGSSRPQDGKRTGTRFVILAPTKRLLAVMPQRPI